LYPAKKDFNDQLAISLMWELLHLMPSDWEQLMGRPFHVGAVELNLCEVDKYFKAKYIGQRCKRIRFYQDDHRWSGPQHRHEHIRRQRSSKKKQGSMLKAPPSKHQDLHLCWLCNHKKYESRFSKNSFLQCRNSRCSFSRID
jgi:hypothetical protein